MDISIFIFSGAVFLPLLFVLLIITTKLTLQYIDKRLTNWGLGVSNLVSLLSFIYLKLFYLNQKNINYIYELPSIGDLKIDFGILTDKTNIDFLIYCALVYFLISIYSIIYFDKNKQFIFTKPKYYIFLGLLGFNTYLFICSQSLIQSLILWIIQGIIILVFSYFDIFKDCANYNITRFYRIFSIGDFLFLVSILILFRYSILSQGYIQSTSINYSQLNELISYTYGIANPFEFIICAIGLIGAITSKMFILPFNCFYSFISNSSNILYLSIITCANSVLGCYLLIKTMPFFEFMPKSLLCFKILLILSIISSLVFLIFEKNIKILFGYIITIINAFFIYSYLTFNKTKSLTLYFILNLIVLILVSFLLYKNKLNIKKQFFNKQKGFFLEKLHIIFFEKIPEIISEILDFINDKITKNLIYTTIKIFNYFLSLFALKNFRNNSYKTLRNIFIIIALIVLMTMFIALFGEK